MAEHSAPSDGARRQQEPLHRQLGPRIFFAGVAFAAFSTFSTRRALARRRVPIQNPILHPVKAPQQLRQAPTAGNIQESAASYQQALAKAHAESANPQIQIPNTPAATMKNDGRSRPQDQEAEAEAEEQPDLQNSGPVMAVEALALATMNVFSWGFIATGALLWYFDIDGIDDMRRKIRGGLGVDGTGRSEQDAEEEMEEWMATVLARKEDKERAASRSSTRNDRGRER